MERGISCLVAFDEYPVSERTDPLSGQCRDVEFAESNCRKVEHVSAMSDRTYIAIDLKSFYASVECGFHSANYFSKVFSAQVGITPTEYRNKKYTRKTAE